MSRTATPPRPRRRRTPALIAAGMLAAGAALAGPTAASAATQVFPSNQTFDATAAPWNSAVDCQVLDILGDGNLVGALLQQLLNACQPSAGHVAAGGNPGGALAVRIDGLQDLAQALDQLGSVTATLASEPFQWGGDDPTSVTLRFDARAEIGGLVGLDPAEFRIFTTIQRAGGPPVEIGPIVVSSADGAWATKTFQLDPRTIERGAGYLIGFRVETRETLRVFGGAPSLFIDNVRLSVSDDPVTPGGPGEPGGPGQPGEPGRPGEPGQPGGQGQGAGGLGACETNVREPAPPELNPPSGTFTLSRQQLAINQRISSEGVRRINTVLDRFMAGLTSADVQDCVIGPEKFPPALRQAIAQGRPAGPATPAEGPRPTPKRTTGPDETSKIQLSRSQLVINQRISSAAVRRVNAIQKRLRGGVTAGDFRRGSLEPVSLNTAARITFANALPRIGADGTAFVPFDIRAPQGKADTSKFTLSRSQLIINQRISSAAVRRINEVRAQLQVGLGPDNFANGGLARATLAPSIQRGER